MLGRGDKALLSEIERGEDYFKEEFGCVLKDDWMSVESMTVVERCYQSVLRDQLQDAE